MTMAHPSHEPALCGLEACRRCDDYGVGYAAGKAKAFMELRQHLGAGHAPGCGCEPCLMIRHIFAVKVPHQVLESTDQS